MQKIQSYLYTNRIQLLADVAGFTTEYTNVYQKTVKIYNGVDNVLEFDIKNADQKRIDLSTLSNIELNVMDATGTALPTSPYSITPTLTKGIATVTIPDVDLDDYPSQFFRYSVTASKDGNTVPLYADSRFGVAGTMELISNAMPTFRDDRIYNTFTGEIDFAGNVMHRSSAIPAKFYETVATENLTFQVSISSGFLGKVYLEGTTDMTVSVNSWLNASQTTIFDNISSNVKTSAVSTVSITMPIGSYNYFRLTWQWPPTTSISSYMDIYGGYGADNGPGKVVSVTVF
jgi:hypothetical protein